MRPYEELVYEASTADVTGWGFGWLEGRATEERPPWHFSRLLADRLATAASALDIDTGGGEVVNEAPRLPQHMAVTESWPPNAQRARITLGQRGVEVVETSPVEPLPFPDSTFDLVSARHPVMPNWREIRRVLRPGGHYFAQHVGPSSAFKLIEYFTGPLSEEIRMGRHPDRECADARATGLAVDTLLPARCRMEFLDVGAVVWILRKCVWWVPDFSVEKYDAQLRALDAQMRAGHPLVAHSTRHLFEARREN